MQPIFAQWQRLAVLATIVIALAIPAVVPNAYVMGVITRICLYALLALGLNVVVGFAGLLDLGYVAFFGIGSYVYALLSSPHFALLGEIAKRNGIKALSMGMSADFELAIQLGATYVRVGSAIFGSRG